MEYLLNTWYFAAWSADIKSGELFPRVILNRPLVMFRSSDGAVKALDDRCPHRFAPLSMGRLQGDRVVCGYHGLEFDGGGVCVRNPHPSGKIPAAAKVRAYPLVERHSGIWIWMGEQAADSSLVPDFSKLDDTSEGLSISRRDHMVMDVPYDLIVDNLLDCSHTSFLHDGILGNEPMIAAPTTITQDGDTINVIRYAHSVPPPGMFDMLFRQDGAPVDCWTDFRWNLPSCLLLDVGVTVPGCPKEEGTGYFGTHILTPETDTTTHYHFAATRWNIRSGSETEETRQKISDLRRFAFEQQDEPMIRAQFRNIRMASTDALKPVMLETDVGVVRWRRVMEKKITAERQAMAVAAE
ncbi:aromatic ring-hydroxylating dioxygenase subunit alpha [Mesorhizobium sp. YR577]|uniref:aromatic ring-hydroxylating dioxygenase subunit alpha n=1 Tax=Mesorhizobium sp. YR577 TaxID=1884373 RepID=UPI0008F1BC89|nr:aromatic ring-hydroxylating dioxygenase subunit alpha [Mesorhizobium sp. YR577]SFU16837.1 vanillate O-demethylase monooxygenase subunit [Mesorhizobium sp. YR577]